MNKKQEQEQELSQQWINTRIGEIKNQLTQIGPMRPGRMSMQYQDPKGKRRAYWQISYTRKGRSRTDYIRDQLVDDLKVETQEHDRFKALVKEWVDLSLELSIMKMKDKAVDLPRRTYPKTKKKK